MMIEQHSLIVTPAEAMPTDSTPSKSVSPDHQPALRKAHERCERPLADRIAHGQKRTSS